MQNKTKRFLSTRRFLRDESGHFALIAGVMAAVLLGAAGLAIDFSRMTDAQSDLTNAADAAVLAAVSETAQAGITNDTEQFRVSREQADLFFKAGAESYRGAFVISHTTNVIRNKDGDLQAELCYKARVKASLIKFVGGESTIVENCVTAADGGVAPVATPVYYRVYALLDASASMGLGATKADQDIMESKMGCMFACHLQGTAAAARSFGATLRYDIAKQALAKVVDSIGKDPALKSQFDFEVYKFSNEVTRIAGPGLGVSAVKSAILGSELDLLGGGMGTNIEPTLKSMESKIVFGDGSKPDKAIPVVVLVTDGTENSAHLTDNLWWYNDTRMKFHEPYKFIPAAGWPGQTIQSMQGSYCDSLKKKGALVMTLLTPYVVPTNGPDPWDAMRNAFIRDYLVPESPKQMRACASEPGYYTSASTPSQLDAAFAKLKTLTTTNPGSGTTARLIK